MTDPITGTLNRRGLSEWVNQQLDSLREKQVLSVFYIDLDDFKKINDNYSHNSGDAVLSALSKRIDQTVRQFDQTLHYRFARLSGDELAVVLTNIENREIKHLAKYLLEQITAPLTIDGIQLQLTASIGIGLSNNLVSTFEELLNLADQAMYKAKADGKCNFKVYDSELAEELLYKKNIAREIELSLQNNAFNLVFMPIYTIADQAICKVEVLIRNQSEGLKGIGPDKFIPIA